MLLVVTLVFKRNINELNTQKGLSVNCGDIATKHPRKYGPARRYNESIKSKRTNRPTADKFAIAQNTTHQLRTQPALTTAVS